MDQKLHIILNKADQFQKIHDFARAYGSLCWNLSKVIQRKDLPQIYTMCLPSSYQSRASNEFNDEQSSLGKGLLDLEATREEVVSKVLNAPFRRIDNEISRLADSVAILQMHCKIVQDIRQKYRSRLFKSRLFITLASLSSITLTTSMIMLTVPMQSIGLTASVCTLATGGVYWWQLKLLDEYSNELVAENEMEKTFKRLYSRQLLEKDEFVLSIWRRVHDHLKLGLSASELQELPSISSSDIKKLENVIDKDLPALRRKAAPTYNN